MSLFVATALTIGNPHSYGEALRPHRMAPADLPLAAARWLFLANIVLAAWMYGGTREWARTAVTWLLITNAGLFLIGLIARRRFPRVPVLAGLAVAFLVTQGWFMTWNARRRFIESAQVFVDRIQPLQGWPGFMDAGLVFPTLLLSTALLGAFCLACDLTRNPIWRERLVITLAGTGLSLVLLGLAQRLTEAPSIFWDLERNLGETFFAVFRYHANAGAFINLVLPLMAVLALKSWLPGGFKGPRVFWTLAALLTAASGFVNVSRAANVVCALLILGMGVSIAYLKTKNSCSAFVRVKSTLVLIALAIGMAFSLGVEKTLLRWDLGLWKIAPQEDGRYQAYEVIISSALPEAGAWGFGPGTFEKMFDIHRKKTGSQVLGRWDKAHSDALQTPMEWGWAGAVAWFAIVVGGGIRATRCAMNREFSGDRILAAGIAFSLAGIALHSCVDFPMQIASLELYTVAIAGMAWGMGNEKPAGPRKNKYSRRSTVRNLGELTE